MMVQFTLESALWQLPFYFTKPHELHAGYAGLFESGKSALGGKGWGGGGGVVAPQGWASGHHVAR